MKMEGRINSSTRKFIARNRLAHSGKFDPNRLKRPALSDKAIAKNVLKSLTNFVSLIMANTPETFLKGGIFFTQILSNVVTATQQNFTFLTPAGGKNVLVTEKVAESQDILAICNTTQLNMSVIVNLTNLITELCDGSTILALNGSDPSLNTTTDPALMCIENKFDSSCKESSTSGLSTGGIVAIVVTGVLAVCCVYRCCRSKPKQDSIPTPVVMKPSTSAAPSKKVSPKTPSNLKSPLLMHTESSSSIYHRSDNHNTNQVAPQIHVHNTCLIL